MIGFPQPRFRPCAGCGASVAASELDEHVCDEERRLDYHLFGLREEIASFEEGLAAYLASPEGRFERWYAERCRRRGPA